MQRLQPEVYLASYCLFRAVTTNGSLRSVVCAWLLARTERQIQPRLLNGERTLANGGVQRYAGSKAMPSTKISKSSFLSLLSWRERVGSHALCTYLRKAAKYCLREETQVLLVCGRREVCVQTSNFCFSPSDGLHGKYSGLPITLLPSFAP